MTLIAARKCVRHSAREAVARCSSCSEHFCRECVVEHTGILLCSACLARKVSKVEETRSTKRRHIGEFALTAACVLFLWVVFYGLGQVLKNIPPSVHEGTVWKVLGGS